MIDAIDGETFSDGQKSPETSSNDGLLTILAKSRLIRGMIFFLSVALTNCDKPASDSVQKSRAEISSEVAHYSDTLSNYRQIIEEGDLLLSIFVTHFDRIKSRSSLSEAEKHDLQQLIREYQILFQQFQRKYQRLQLAILNKSYNDKTLRMELEELETHFRLIREPLADLIEKIHAIFTTIESNGSFDRACAQDGNQCL